jgi:ABC-2 type transport system permease protein
VQLIADATDINTATALTGYASSIILDYQASLNGPQAALPLQIETRSRMIFNPHLRSVYIFIPGVISVVLMIISAMLTSMTLTREKENGTMEFLAISPLQPMQIVIGKVLPYLFLSLINCLIIVMMGYFIFDMPMNGSVALLMFESLLYVFTALSLGILISTIAETQQTAMFASLMSLMMPSMLLSGFIFPVESMVWPLQMISKLIPASYFILIIKGIMIKGVGLEVLWQPTLVLLGMTTFFMFMSIRNLKKQYR